MTQAGQDRTQECAAGTAVEACQLALRRVCISLPHLAGLAHKVRVQADERVGTAGVFASGRMLVNPEFVKSLTPADLMFVMAHELLHLALATHARAGESDPRNVNIAHDFIINDILREELGQEIPANGLDLPGARNYSLEQALAAYKLAPRSHYCSWRGPSRAPSPMERAFADAGLTNEPAKTTSEYPSKIEVDVLSDAQEREWFPNVRPDETTKQASEIRAAATKANGLRVILEQLERDNRAHHGSEASGSLATIDALRTTYRPPWELALQRWFDSQTPTERTYTRPSRRGADRTDVVLPGRKREGWTMHIVLDTSGSMTDDLSTCLGVIGAFCESASVTEVHILQCDVEVTVDEWIAPEELDTYTIRGFGGSDMSPAMRRLAEDPDVEAAIVITDGGIDFPSVPMPYEVLWAVLEYYESYFHPSYGAIAPIPVQSLRSL